MGKHIWLAVLLISISVVATATAAPVLEAFVGKFENGNIAVLTGQDFGSRGLLTSSSGPIAADTQPTRVVVLGDAPIWADCQTRYQLLTSAWANESIFVKFDVPAELQAKPSYLFVVNDEGEPSAGMGPLTYGKGITEGPGQPGTPTRF